MAPPDHEAAPDGDAPDRGLDGSGQSPSPLNDLDGTLVAEGDSASAASSGKYESMGEEEMREEEMREEETTGDRATESMLTANSYHTARLEYPSPTSVFTSSEGRGIPDMGQGSRKCMYRARALQVWLSGANCRYEVSLEELVFSRSVTIH